MSRLSTQTAGYTLNHMGSAGRRTTPLFDLVQGKSGASSKLSGDAAVPIKPVIRVELKPSPAPGSTTAAAERTTDATARAATPVPVAEALPAPVAAPIAGPAPSTPHLREAPMPPRETTMHDRTWAPAWLGESMLRVPVNALSIGVALAIVVALVAWIVGVSTGQSRAEDELARFERSSPIITDPLVQEPGPDQPSGTQSAATSKAAPKAEPRKPPSASRTSGSITSKGVLEGDPREASLNYLALATLDGDAALAAVTFLSENGLESFAVPVDSAPSRANNPDPAVTYRLFAFPGVSSEEYKRRATKVTNLEAEVARLGAVWQKQHRGVSNFSRTQWEKYKE